MLLLASVVVSAVFMLVFLIGPLLLSEEIFTFLFLCLPSSWSTISKNDPRKVMKRIGIGGKLRYVHVALIQISI